MAIPCASIPLPRFAFLFNSTAFQISANPWPFQSPRNLSPAVLVPSQLNSSSAFHRYSSPLRNCSAPCCSNARPFNAKPFPCNSYLLLALPPLFCSVQLFSAACLDHALPRLFCSMQFHCRSVQVHAVPLLFIASLNSTYLRFSEAHLCHSHLCHCISMLRFSTAFPIQSGQCYSDATLTGSPHFLCWP